MTEFTHRGMLLSLLRYNPKRDTTERQLIGELNQRGITTMRCSDSGMPDVWGIHRGRWVAIEIKSEKGKLTQKQRHLFSIARRLEAPIYIIRSSADIELMMIDLLERS